MKKIGKILLLSFMTIGLVAGCELSDFKSLINDSNDSSQDNTSASSKDEEGDNNNYGDSSSNPGNTDSGSSSGSSSSNKNDDDPSGWKNEYAAIMRAHLYDILLPYTGDANTVVAYDETYDMVTLVGGNVTLAGYKALLIADNYELLGEDEETGEFAVEKEVNTSDGKRFVYLYAEIDEEDGFSAQAFDPYYYSWPTEAIAAFFEDYEATSFDVPTIDAEGAYFAFQEDQYNIWYLVLEMEDYVNANLVAYECSQSDFTTYYNKLDAAGWELEEQTSEGETYYVCTLNIENVGVARMELYYSASYEAISLTIYVYMSAPDIIPGTTYTSWPAIQIATMLGSSVKDTVPEYTGTNNGFQLLDDYYGMAVVVLVDKGTEEAGAATYVAALPTAGYVLDGKTAIGDDRYVSPNEEIYVSVFPAATPGTITIYFEAAEPTTQTNSEWPAARIKEELGSSVTDVVPALDGANDYAIFADSDSIQVQAVYSTYSEMVAAQETYAGILKTAGYTEAGRDSYDDMYYNSPNNQINVCPWLSTSNGYKVIIDIFYGVFEPASTEWPSAKIASFMTNNGYKDVLPAYNGGTSYDVDDEGDELYIIIATSDAESAVDAYCDLLEKANFSYEGVDDYGDPLYYSPNEEYSVNPYVSSTGAFVIWVF